MDEQVSQLLESWAKQDASARERLMPLVYEELRRLAHHYMRGERENHIEETADALDISPTTVKREWASARAWLHHQLRAS